MEVFFLTFSPDGEEEFYVQGGRCSALKDGAQVVTHHSSIDSKFTSDTNCLVPVSQLPARTILSGPKIKKITVPDGDDALRGALGWLDDD